MWSPPKKKSIWEGKYRRVGTKPGLWTIIESIVQLKEYEFAASVTSEFIADIFGKHVGNTFYAGLVDSASLGEFDERFEYLKPVWEL